MKIILNIFIALIVILYIGVSYIFFVSEIYDFPEPEHFKGEYLYNPYQDLKGDWVKANFQAHTKSDYGITSGNQDAEELLEIYRRLNYDLIYISDYHRINRALDTNHTNFIPIYEHGYSLIKAHRLVFGAEEVSYFDIPIYFGLSGKQYMINRLKKESMIIALAHPAFMNGHSPDDLEYLSNYDILEVSNHFRNSSLHWDAALSSGKPVWLIANDDSHDLDSEEETGRCWTMLNVKDNSADEVINALKTGRAYGVQGWRGENMNHLKRLSVEGLTVNVEFDNKGEIGIIGENGKMMRPVFYGDRASYQFKPGDSYIRFEIVDQATRSKIFLNPVIRYDGHGYPVNRFTGVVDQFMTYSMRISILLSYLLIGLLLYIHVKNHLLKRNFSGVATPKFVESAG